MEIEYSPLDMTGTDRENEAIMFTSLIAGAAEEERAKSTTTIKEADYWAGYRDAWRHMSKLIQGIPLKTEQLALRTGCERYKAMEKALHG